MIHLVTSFYLIENPNEVQVLRNNELIESLIKNIESPIIKEIHLFVDNIHAFNKINEINSEKIVIIRIGKQPFYSELFDYAITNLENKICMISNSDIYIHEYDINILNKLENNIFTLTRYEHDMSCHLIDKYVGSHDVFIFKSPLNKMILQYMNHHQNVWGSECLIIDILVDNGYKLYNPCHQIKICHLHKSDFRNEDRIRIHNGIHNAPPCYL